jgi:hypothetical protein
MVLAAIGAGLIGGALYFALPPSCVVDEHAMRGEVRRESSGKVLYFDGRCWTTKPVAPTDTPF